MMFYGLRLPRQTRRVWFSRAGWGTFVGHHRGLFNGHGHLSPSPYGSTPLAHSARGPLPTSAHHLPMLRIGPILPTPATDSGPYRKVGPSNPSSRSVH